MMPYARLIGLNYTQALISVLIGGIGGFLFFYYLSGWFIKKVKIAEPFLCWFVPQFLKRRYAAFCEKQTKRRSIKKVFSKKNRFIARLKRSYGFWGIIFTTPVLLTIPLGAFLVKKYYSKRRHVISYMIISITAWAVILTTAIQIFPNLF